LLRDAGLPLLLCRVAHPHVGGSGRPGGGRFAPGALLLPLFGPGIVCAGSARHPAHSGEKEIMMARLARPLLWLACILLGAISVGFLLLPKLMGSYVALDLTPAPASTDVRAVYGGFQLAMSIFFGICAYRDELRLGLLAATLGTAGFAVGRSLGIVLDG